MAPDRTKSAWQNRWPRRCWPRAPALRPAILSGVINVWLGARRATMIDAPTWPSRVLCVL